MKLSKRQAINRERASRVFSLYYKYGQFPNRYLFMQNHPEIPTREFWEGIRVLLKLGYISKHPSNTNTLSRCVFQVLKPYPVIENKKLIKFTMNYNLEKAFFQGHAGKFIKIANP